MKCNLFAAMLAMLFLSSAVCAYVPDYMSLLWNNSIKETISGLSVGDLNGDSSMEILASSSAEGIVYAFDYNGNVLWKFGVPGYVNFVRAVDLNSDNKSEILTGTSNHLYVLNSSGELLWKFYTENNNVENAEAMDIDGDGLKDILFNANSGTCGGNAVYALSSNTTKTIWIYDSGFYYPNVFSFVDVNNEQKILLGMIFAPRSVGGCIPLESKNSRIVALNKSGEVLWMFNTTGGVMDIKTGDINGDGFTEIVLASSPYVYVLNQTGTLIWREDLEDRVDAIALGAVKEGKMRILAATHRAYLFDADGLDYITFNTTDRAYSAAAADLNNDGNSEYIIGSDRVYVYDYHRDLLWNSSRLLYVGYLSVANVDNTPDLEVVAGADKQVIVFKVGVRAKIQEADVYYNRAQQLYSSGQYTSALNYALQARDIYSKFQQDSDFKKTRSLIDLINGKINSTSVISKEADVYYEISMGYYGSEDFINASINAQIARAKYESAGNKERAAASEEIINKSREFLSRNASMTSGLAFQTYGEGDYDLALEYAKTARMFYLFLKNNSEASKIDELIEQINSVRKPPVSESIADFINRPEIRKYFYPSEYQAVNLTIWVVYLMALALVLVGVHSALKRVLQYLYQRLTRKTLDLDKIGPKDAEQVSAEKQARIILVFYLLTFLAVVLMFIYLLFFRT